jgi:Spy/CpxP family protein refolding chaperone
MKLSKILTAASLAVVLALSAGSLMAQDNNNDRQNRRNRDGGQGGPGGPGGGNFDPAQFQQRMMERTKEQLEITDDTEWKALEPLVQKVMDARRETMSGLGRGFGRGNRGGGDNNNGGPRGGFGGTPSPEAEALQKAIDAKAPNAEIKAALAKYNEARKAKQAALEKAQAELRKALTPRQEAIAAVNGLL